MLNEITEVFPLEGYRLRLKFNDGVIGEVALPDIVPFEGIFEPLREWERFRKVKVNAELGSIEWENGADLDPDVLHEMIMGKKMAA